MESNKTPELISEILLCGTNVQNYISALESEIVRLAKSLATTQAKELSSRNRADELKKQLAKSTRETSTYSDSHIKKIIHQNVMDDGGWDSFCEKNHAAITASYPQDELDYDEHAP